MAKRKRLPANAAAPAAADPALFETPLAAELDALESTAASDDLTADESGDSGEFAGPDIGLSTDEAIEVIGCRPRQFRHLVKIGLVAQAGRASVQPKGRWKIKWSTARWNRESVQRIAEAATIFDQVGNWQEALRQVDLARQADEPRQPLDGPGAEIIAIAMRKGGVGKTTTAYNLAGALACHPENDERARKPVLIVDLDPQATLTRKFYEGYQAAELPAAVADLFGDDPEAAVEAAIQRTWLANIDIIPMRPQNRRVFADSDPARLAALATSLHRRNVPTEHWAAEFERHISEEMVKLRDALHAVRNRYGHIVIDCANNVTFVIQAGLLAADSVIIPTGHDVESLDGYLDICEDLAWLESTVGYAPPVLGLLGNILYPRDSVGAWVLENHYAPAAAEHGHEFFTTELKRASTIKEAMTALRPLAFQNRKSSGKEMFAATAREVIGRIAARRARDGAPH